METQDKRFDGFDDWADVVRSFDIVGAERTEPTQILAANYNHEGYEGDAFVAYRRGRGYFVVTGGHCSCYGLEQQWEPEGPWQKRTFRQYLTQLTETGYGASRAGAIEALKHL